MNIITQKIQRFLEDESGPTAVEYAVMIALIIIVCIASVGLVGQSADELFQTSGNTIQQINATGGE
jgi:pilus assembly protein Flp/PilA